MQKILKRLELIKTAITIEDEEIVELQVMKLDTAECDAGIRNILEKIAEKDYGNVVLDIESYLEKFSGVVVYEDKELLGLRLELKALEQKLQELSSKKNEYLNDINDFNTQYHLHVGEVIQKILNLKETLLQEGIQEKRDAFETLKEEYTALKEEQQALKSKKETQEQMLDEMDEFDDGYDEIYEELQAIKEELDKREKELNEKRKETKQAKEEFEEDETTQEYEEVKRDSEEFSKEHEEVKKEERFDISEEEKKELKKLFRQASRLCHPDLVTDELKEQAHDMMQKLNEAYSKHDIQAVKTMLISLESGNGFDVASDTITDKALLRTKIVDVRDMILNNEAELQTIAEDEVIKILNEYEDVEEYFSALEEELEAEYFRLQEMHHIEQKEIKKEDNASEEAYWEEAY